MSLSTDLAIFPALTDDVLERLDELSLEERLAQLVMAWTVVTKQSLVLAEKIGGTLIEAKASMGHGRWLPWLQEHWPASVDQAERFMEVARNSAKVRNLPPDTSLKATVTWLRQQRRLDRGPRTVVETDGLDGEVDVEDVREPLLRFTAPDTPTHVIVADIVRVCFPDVRTCLDVTYGLGNFWNGKAPFKLTAHDLDPDRAPDGAMDFTDLQYEDASFDLVAIDTPHLADGGDEAVVTGRFGTVATQEALETLITDGVREAWRVCQKGVVVKITDHVHGRVFNDMSLLVCDAIGSWPYDKVHQTRSHAFIDPSWGQQLSAYNNGSTFLIFRKGEQVHVPRSR